MPTRIHNIRPAFAMLPARVAGHTEGRSRQHGRALHTGSAAWRRIRLQVLVRDLYICQACGVQGDESMHVDHVNGDANDNRLENLQALHPDCHSRLTATHDAGFGNAPKERKERSTLGSDGVPVGNVPKNWNS